MPVDYQQIKSQVTDWGNEAPQREQAIRRLREECLPLFGAINDPQALAEKIDAAARANPHLRTAAPAGELPASQHPLPTLTADPIVVAADGSQINPDSHAAVEFCVINVGAILMGQGSRPPSERVKSTLLAAEALYDDNGRITEEVVALRRDLEERQFISSLAGELPDPVIAITDGPLELYMERDSSQTARFRQLFAAYLAVLEQVAARGVITAGYVDKPHADLLVRMLEIQRLEMSELAQAGKTRPYRGVIDSDLFHDRLQPGERSAVFSIVSPSAQYLTGPLALHFFYLNAGRPGSPWITRVEIPAWTAGNQAALDMLHAVLVQQCRILGNAPYPYVLHRAHEVAVVRMPERDMIEGMLQAELISRGLPPGRQSNKQHNKGHIGRTR